MVPPLLGRPGEPVTPYSAIQSLCGLSNREAAEFHGVAEITVKSWRSGKRPAPDGALGELLDLWTAIDNAAVEAAEELMRVFHDAGAMPSMIEIGYPADDHEAQGLGFPCVGAWRQMAGRLIDELASILHEPVEVGRIRFVPRGSTPATAKAIDVREA